MAVPTGRGLMNGEVVAVECLRSGIFSLVSGTVRALVGVLAPEDVLCAFEDCGKEGVAVAACSLLLLFQFLICLLDLLSLSFFLFGFLLFGLLLVRFLLLVESTFCHCGD